MNRREALAALVSMPEIARLSVAPVRPNDVIVVECEGTLSTSTADRIHAQLKEIWPNNKIVILDELIRIKVVSGGHP